MIIRIYDYNGKGKLVKIPDDCEYIEFDILNGGIDLYKLMLVMNLANG